MQLTRYKLRVFAPQSNAFVNEIIYYVAQRCALRNDAIFHLAKYNLGNTLCWVYKWNEIS